MKKSQLEEQIYKPKKDYTVVCIDCGKEFNLSELNKLTYESCLNRDMRKDFKCLKVKNHKLEPYERFYKCPCCKLILPSSKFKLIRENT